MIHDIIKSLRDCAYKCQQFARECGNADISSLFEELGIDLMEKALVLEHKFDRV